jgi:hypothetical protein
VQMNIYIFFFFGARVSTTTPPFSTPSTPFPHHSSLLISLQGISTVLLVNYVTIFQILGPWFRWATWASYAHAGFFQFAVVNILFSYLRAATTDPGSVEKGTATEADIIPPMTEAEKAINLKMKRRFCPKCKCIKPPRAHHCSTCHRCINKMGESSIKYTFDS